MPIFTRRSIQLMLDELAPWLSMSKARDFVHRLDHVQPDQAIPFEYELALTWAVSKVADLEIERPVGSKEPDIFSSDLFPSGPAHVEIAAVSDVALSGEAVMTRAANIIMAFANSIVKRSGRHLYFEFQVESGYIPPSPSAQSFFSWAAKSRYFRRRKINNNFVLTEEIKEKMVAWLKSPPPRNPIRLTNSDVDVVVQWRDSEVHQHANIFSSMPSEAHDIKENPVWRVLKDKEREQLSAVPQGVRRMIFLCDAGCSLLRNVNPIGRPHNTVSGKEVIRAFLAESTIDGVCVFTPGRRSKNAFQTWNNPLIWRVHIFDLRVGITEAEYANVEAIKNLLPAPVLESYQARSWHQQGMFAPQAHGQFLPAQWRRSGSGVETVKISSRGVQEFFAGRLSREQFNSFVDSELFEQALKEGKTISSVTLEPREADQDDDYLIFEFAPDPSAMPLRVPDVIEVNMFDGPSDTKREDQFSKLQQLRQWVSRIELSLSKKRKNLTNNR